MFKNTKKFIQGQMKDIRNLKESQELELKSEWSDSCLRSLCAFANTDGGKLMLGIDDEGKR